MAWKWTKQREKAAKLAAEDALTNEQIADAVGITRHGLDLWKLQPEFQARVAEIVTAYADAIRDEGIANVKNRVAAQNDRWDRMKAVIEARAIELAAVPGGNTGLLVHTYKMAGGKEPVVMDEYAVDTGLLAELRAHEKQAAQELGQWTEKQEVTGKGGKPIAVATTAFAFDAYRALFLAAGDGGTPAAGDGPHQPVDTALPDA